MANSSARNTRIRSPAKTSCPCSRRRRRRLRGSLFRGSRTRRVEAASRSPLCSRHQLSRGARGRRAGPVRRATPARPSAARSWASRARARPRQSGSTTAPRTTTSGSSWRPRKASSPARVARAGKAAPITDAAACPVPAALALAGAATEAERPEGRPDPVAAARLAKCPRARAAVEGDSRRFGFRVPSPRSRVRLGSWFGFPSTDSWNLNHGPTRTRNQERGTWDL